MFRKLLLLSFIATVVPSYAGEAGNPTLKAKIRDLEKKVDIIVDNALEVVDILIGESTIDEMTKEESDMLISLLEKQLAKTKKKEDEISKKASKQDIDNRIKMLRDLFLISIGCPY
ncbi:MAG TPA: hypothetical protein ENI08_02585 [Candidatus Dependentiae bacterium]|nr:hypothetical protein [Candidatus Dependentiae bacterium]